MTTAAHTSERRRGRIEDDGRYEAALAGSDVGVLTGLRAELIETSNRIRAQLEAESAASMEELARLLDDGMSVAEAGIHKVRMTDHEWRRRAKAALRVHDSWLAKLRARIVQLSPSGRPLRAACVPGVVRNGESVAVALNHLLDSGCKILAFGVVGADLVVLASEPGAPISMV